MMLGYLDGGPDYRVYQTILFARDGLDPDKQHTVVGGQGGNVRVRHRRLSRRSWLTGPMRPGRSVYWEGRGGGCRSTLRSSLSIRESARRAWNIPICRLVD
jgi:hypothetical protein